MSHFNTREIADRFIRYASVYTQSKEGVADNPSTSCQRDLAKILYEELLAMGASDVSYDEEHCYVYASVQGNIPADPDKTALLPDAAAKRRENTAPILGLVAHMDTSDAVDAKEIHPRLIENYDGRPVILSESPTYILDPADYPELSKEKGNTLIVTDGTSVLGGDDKAGITQIMEVFRFYLQHPEYAHGTIRLMFTPDEEVGNGTMHVDRRHFAVDYAYTIDGSAVGELEYENFNAASASIDIQGLSTHPGDAKDKMKNALLIGMELNALLPPDEIPARTEGYEGFYHLDEMSGTTDHAHMEYILRDHDRSKFEEKKQKVTDAAQQLNKVYGEGTVTLKIEDSYYNMAEKILPHRHLIDNAKEAMQELGVTPVTQPIRGGTDGCKLSFEGIPCPNLGTGAFNYHSRYEYVSAQQMETGAEILLRILNKYAEFEINR